MAAAIGERKVLLTVEWHGSFTSVGLDFGSLFWDPNLGQPDGWPDLQLSARH